MKVDVDEVHSVIANGNQYDLKLFRYCLYTEAYLAFLDFLLQIFRCISTLFQSCKILIHCLIMEYHRVLRSTAGNFFSMILL